MEVWLYPSTAEFSKLAVREGCSVEKISEWILKTMDNIGYELDTEDHGLRIKDVVTSNAALAVITTAVTCQYKTSNKKIIENLIIIIR